MNEERYQKLFDAWSESRLTPDEAAELSTLLRTDARARARFRGDAAFHGQLHAALDGLNLDQACAQGGSLAFPARRSAFGFAAMLVAAGLTAVSLGLLLNAKADAPELRPLGMDDGDFEKISGRLPAGFPSTTFTWGGDPSEVAAGGGRPTTLRFLEAAGEPNVANSPSQSCDVFQVIDLKTVRSELMRCSEAFVELQADFLDARHSGSKPVRFIAKVYAFEGQPESIFRNWPPASDQVLSSGAQFHVSRGGAPQAWRTLTTRCSIPANAGFLVVQIGAGSADLAGHPPPPLGEQFADNIHLTLHTRRPKAEMAVR